jgi:hypothetical protein
MTPDSADVRASFTFYPADSRALRRLTLALRDGGLDVERTDVFRLLLHVTSELDMMALATVRLRQEANQAAGDEFVDERFTVTLRPAWLKKLDRAVDELARKDVAVRRTFVARSVVHAEHNVKALARATEKFFGEFPDRRTCAARKAKDE